MLFASELQCLLEHPDVSRELDPIAIAEYLKLGWIPEPRTPFAAVRRVPAGCFMRFHQSGDVGRCFSRICSAMIIFDLAFRRTMSAPLELRQTSRVPPPGKRSMADTATFFEAHNARTSCSLMASCIALLIS